jgi:hypothetical protein
MLSNKEKDIVALAKSFLFDFAKHGEADFKIAKKDVLGWLGTILLLEAKLKVKDDMCFLDSFTPREYAEYLVSENDKTLDSLGIIDLDKLLEG